MERFSKLKLQFDNEQPYYDQFCAKNLLLSRKFDDLFKEYVYIDLHSQQLEEMAEKAKNTLMNLDA